MADRNERVQVLVQELVREYDNGKEYFMVTQETEEKYSYVAIDRRTYVDYLNDKGKERFREIGKLSADIKNKIISGE